MRIPILYLSVLSSLILSTLLFSARFYDPQLGRWVTVDPADEFFSPYIYVGNDPINFVDPDGRYTEGSAKDAKTIAASLTYTMKGFIPEEIITEYGLGFGVTPIVTKSDDIVFRVTSQGDWDGALANMRGKYKETESLNPFRININGEDFTSKVLDMFEVAIYQVNRTDQMMDIHFSDKYGDGGYLLHKPLEHLFGRYERGLYLWPQGNPNNPQQTLLGIFFHEYVGHGKHPKSGFPDSYNNLLDAKFNPNYSPRKVRRYHNEKN